MKRVGVADLKNNLSRHLRTVEAGEALEVTDHDRPIAHLVPVEASSRLQIHEPTRPFDEIAHKQYAPLNLPISSTELLRQDRVGRRPRWISREEFVRRVVSQQADVGLRDDLRRLAPGTTGDTPLP